MNRQKLEHLLTTMDMVNRYTPSEEVGKALDDLQERYRGMTGHFFHFRENIFFENGRQNSKLDCSDSSADTYSPQTETSNATPPNEADNILIPENFDMNYEEE